MLSDIDPTVAKFIDAVNANNRSQLFDVLAENATMSDDGTDHDLRKWTDAEIFSAHGRLAVESVDNSGTQLIANYTNERWGSMRTAWRFVVKGNKIARFETGQA